MKVTVGICTWNRAELLDSTLTSLAQVEVPDGVTWQVIVADNNSTDHTPEIIDRHTERLPLTSIFVGRQGKSHALNAIVERLDGDLVLWTDDDVLFAPGWLAAYVETARHYPGADFFGGAITPRFLGPEPAWLRPAWRDLAAAFGERHLGDKPLVIERRRLPFGANLGVRVDLQKEFRFDPDLGRCGEFLLTGEETDMVLRWLHAGHVGIWTPWAHIEHLLTPDRMELEYLTRLFFSNGETKKLQKRQRSLFVRLFRGAWYALGATKHRLRLRCCSAKVSPQEWIYRFVRCNYYWGRAESQWHDLPDWMKPASIRRLKQQRRHPRTACDVISFPKKIERPYASVAMPTVRAA